MTATIIDQAFIDIHTDRLAIAAVARWAITADEAANSVVTDSQRVTATILSSIDEALININTTSVTRSTEATWARSADARSIGIDAESSVVTSAIEREALIDIQAPC